MSSNQDPASLGIRQTPPTSQECLGPITGLEDFASQELFAVHGLDCHNKSWQAENELRVF